MIEEIKLQHMTLVGFQGTAAISLAVFSAVEGVSREEAIAYVFEKLSSHEDFVKIGNSMIIPDRYDSFRVE